MPDDKLIQREEKCIYCETDPDPQSLYHCKAAWNSALHCGTVLWQHQQQNESRMSLVQQGGEMPRWHLGRWTHICQMNQNQNGERTNERERLNTVLHDNVLVMPVARQNILRLVLSVAGSLVISLQTSCSRIGMESSRDHLFSPISARLLCSHMSRRTEPKGKPCLVLERHTSIRCESSFSQFCRVRPAFAS